MRYFRNSDVIALLKLLGLVSAACDLIACLTGGWAAGWPAAVIACSFQDSCRWGMGLWRSGEIERLC